MLLQFRSTRLTKLGDKRSVKRINQHLPWVLEVIFFFGGEGVRRRARKAKRRNKVRKRCLKTVYRLANDPGPQIIPRSQMISIKKIGNGVESRWM